jgi:hypothetical protein
LMALRDPAAEASFAANFACNILGIAMAAMTRMIATTISNSINENPLLERISKPPYKGEQIEGGRLICCSFVAKLLGPA